MDSEGRKVVVCDNGTGVSQMVQSVPQSSTLAALLDVFFLFYRFVLVFKVSPLRVFDKV